MRKILSGRRASSVGAFKMLIDTTKTAFESSASDQFTFPIINGTDKMGLTINFTIDWGDGTVPTPVTAANYLVACQHTYATGGQYEVSATGSIAGFGFYNAAHAANRKDSQKLIEIRQWGDLLLTGGSNASGAGGVGQAFRGCSNLTDVTCTDIPTFPVDPIVGTYGSNLGLRALFSDCTSLVTINKLADWNVTNCRNMNGTFVNCNSLLSGAIGVTGVPLDFSNWDVEKVYDFTNAFAGVNKVDLKLWTSFGTDLQGAGANFSRMFLNCANFTGTQGGITQWGSKTSVVSTMFQMFRGAKRFDGDISNFDTSNVQSMYEMFSSNGLSVAQQMIFNQNISVWDVSNVNDMRGIFTNCASFDQPIGDWDVSAWANNTVLVQPLAVPGGVFQLSNSNYNSLLLQWDAYSFSSMPNGTVNFGTSQYSLVSPGPGNLYTNARNSLIAKWGGISDGGGI
jgi:trimeric autotransporter adhesin